MIIKLFRLFHLTLVHNPLTRRYQRRFTRLTKRILACPEAYGDLFAIAKIAKPAAVLDIGAFVGDTVVRFLDELRLPIYCFEPTQRSFEILSKRFKNEPKVNLFNCALADREGEMAFHSNQNLQTNSLLENDQGNIQSFPDYTRHVSLSHIVSMTLDKWADKYAPDGSLLVKADVQGAEMRLLGGGHRTFKDRVVAFYTEVQLAAMYKEQATFDSLHKRLQELGFCLLNLYPCGHDSIGRAFQTDGLWVKETFLQQHPRLSA